MQKPTYAHTNKQYTMQTEHAHITCLPYTYKCANLGATYGTPTEALAETSGAAEDVVG